MRTQVRKIGNSLGNIIPATFVRELGLAEGADIEVRTDNGKIIIEPVKRKKRKLPFSEQDLVKGMTPYTAHVDELAEISEEEFGA
ncbi:AbrB/MazE/SpoVT family DNA-binding domain-containing protein [Vibrio parahaemolyticus]|nr:AbrB/MazE/SpoVT family DNA-binding domain-containing protein [Vibrio parahaemolyticus]